MAESPVERLKRQARERREAAEAAAKVTEVTEVSNAGDTSTVVGTSTDTDVSTVVVTTDDGHGVGSSVELSTTVSSSNGSSDDSTDILPSDTVSNTTELPEPTELATLSEPVVLQKVSRNHPLVREMEELEAALEQNVPGFVTLLRDIHKKLAEDPLTVTLLSLEERGTIVKGMTRHANVTITTKALKSTSKAKKGPVTAADL